MFYNALYKVRFNALYTLLGVFNLRIMIKEIEIKNIGQFKIRHDLMHRGNRPRLKPLTKEFTKKFHLIATLIM